MTKIKLCGILREEDIVYVNELLPDHIGFVFAPMSRRYITPRKALMLREQLSAEVIPVGVFVDEKPEVIADIVSSGAIDMIQLHGKESSEYISRLRRLTSVPVIQAFRIGNPEDIAAVNDSVADIVLLDSGCGSGKTFDHSLINGVSRPFFLAGGLTPENVREAIDSIRPYAVDTSSSLETGGFKDYKKMKAFVDAVRRH